MKDLIGRWRISEIAVFDETKSEQVWKKAEEAINDPNIDKDIKQMINAVIEFDDQNVMSLLVSIPEYAKEEVEEALAAGEVTLKDGMLVAETFNWKIENDKPYYDSRYECEIMGEKLSPWVEIKETPDGYEIMTFRIVKI